MSCVDGISNLTKHGDRLSIAKKGKWPAQAGTWRKSVTVNQVVVLKETACQDSRLVFSFTVLSEGSQRW